MTDECPGFISYSFKLFLVVIRYAYHVNIPPAEFSPANKYRNC